MRNIIISNNPLVAEKYENVFFVDGSVEETLVKVRDLVYEGHELVSHPLAASLRVLFSPYRSVIVANQCEQLNFDHAEIIEGSICKYKKHMDVRKADEANSDDYKTVDLLLLQSALNDEKGKW
ncbi:MAG: GrdX family protein [Syntrophomonadaceae bacterium]|nr:GrdX family protein [Syntrophomonadaceae bacterium]MDD4549036.1 GrdX family protein [Syntrophomonadaceae bacterium]